MSIMLLKKKKYRFQVDCVVEELTAVPYVNAILFAKLRLLVGGTFSEESPRIDVRDHSVRWHKTFSFQCRMTANASTTVLDACHCRISIRKEVQGGRSCEKLGFVDLNLATFAGQGATSQRFLLEGYRQNHRLDNSILRVTVNMTLLAGDPCFKTSSRSSVTEGDGQSAPNSNPPLDGGSPSPDSSPMQPCRVILPTDVDYSSLPRRQHCPDGGSSGGSSAETPPPLSQTDKADSCSLAATESGAGLTGDFGNCGSSGCLAGQGVHQRLAGGGDSAHLRNHSSGSTYYDSGSLKDRGKRSSQKNAFNMVEGGGNSRMDSTREDPIYLIDQLLLSTKLSPSSVGGELLCPSPLGALSSGPDSGVGIDNDAETESGLRQFIGRDVVAALTSKDYR